MKLSWNDPPNNAPFTFDMNTWGIGLRLSFGGARIDGMFSLLVG